VTFVVKKNVDYDLVKVMGLEYTDNGFTKIRIEKDDILRRDVSEMLGKVDQDDIDEIDGIEAAAKKMEIGLAKFAGRVFQGFVAVLALFIIM